MPVNDTSLALARFFKLMGDPTRVAILVRLLEGERNVNDLAQGLDMTKSAISHQLRKLREAGAVVNRRVGKEIYYRLEDDHVTQVILNSLEHFAHKGDHL